MAEVDSLQPRRNGRAQLHAPWVPPSSDGYSAMTIAEEYLSSLAEVIRAIDMDAVERMVQHLRVARESGGTIFIAGNGGSAATASHLANDLGKATKPSGRAPMRVMCLSDNVSWLTALANDEGYDRAFAGQIENFASRGDVLVVLSASGNSPNLVAAVEVAQAAGAEAIGLLGFDGGRLREILDDCVWLPTPKGSYEVVEDGHSALCHTLTLCLAADLAVPARIG